MSHPKIKGLSHQETKEKLLRLIHHVCETQFDLWKILEITVKYGRKFHTHRALLSSSYGASKRDLETSEDPEAEPARKKGSGQSG